MQPICPCLTNLVIQLTNNCSITYRQMFSTYYIVFSHQDLLLHRITFSILMFTMCSYRIILIILLTVTLSHGCYSATFIKTCCVTDSLKIISNLFLIHTPLIYQGCARDLSGRDRDEIRDAWVRDRDVGHFVRDETETRCSGFETRPRSIRCESETRPRRICI